MEGKCTVTGLRSGYGASLDPCIDPMTLVRQHVQILANGVQGDCDLCYILSTAYCSSLVSAKTAVNAWV